MNISKEQAEVFKILLKSDIDRLLEYASKEIDDSVVEELMSEREHLLGILEELNKKRLVLV